MAEAETLREVGSHRERLLEILVCLDAFGDDRRPGAFVVGEDTGQRVGSVALCDVLDHRHIDLDDVGFEDVEHRE